MDGQLFALLLIAELYVIAATSYLLYTLRQFLTIQTQLDIGTILQKIQNNIPPNAITHITSWVFGMMDRVDAHTYKKDEVCVRPKIRNH